MTAGKSITGNAIVLGDFVNTDELHPSAFFSLDPARRAQGFLVGVGSHRAPSQAGHSMDPAGGGALVGIGSRPAASEGFPPPPYVIVAGRDFGAGSSRETTLYALKDRGVLAVVCRSAGRIFARNAFNLGLPVLHFAAGGPLPTTVSLATGTTVSLDPDLGALTAAGQRFPLEPPDPYLRALYEHGGLIPWLQARGAYPRPGTE